MSSSRPFDFVALVSHRHRQNGIRRIAAAMIVALRITMGFGLMSLPGDESAPTTISSQTIAHAGLDSLLKAVQSRLSPSSRRKHGHH